MNSLILVACFAAVALAAPIEKEEHIEPFFELKQVHDVDGSYSFTYASEDASKTETRTASGEVRGAYSYIDSDGILQKVQYVADENGFQAYGTNLPVGSTVPVKETPEVLEATAEHFARIDEHIKKIAIAAKLHAEFKLAHPEFFLDEEEKHEVHHVIPIPVVVKPINKPLVRFTDDELPVAPEEDPEVLAAREEHLALVQKLTEEHYAALAAAPKHEEE